MLRTCRQRRGSLSGLMWRERLWRSRLITGWGTISWVRRSSLLPGKKRSLFEERKQVNSMLRMNLWFEAAARCLLPHGLTKFSTSIDYRQIRYTIICRSIPPGLRRRSLRTRFQIPSWQWASRRIWVLSCQCSVSNEVIGLTKGWGGAFLDTIRHVMRSITFHIWRDFTIHFSWCYLYCGGALKLMKSITDVSKHPSTVKK